MRIEYGDAEADNSEVVQGGIQEGGKQGTLVRKQFTPMASRTGYFADPLALFPQATCA